MIPTSGEDPPLLFERDVIHDVHVLGVCGNVDIVVKEQFETALMAAVDGVHSPLIIDLTRVSYMDSSGFNALVRAKRRMIARNDELYIVLKNVHLQKIFEMLNFDKVFRIHDTLDGAVAAARYSDG